MACPESHEGVANGVNVIGKQAKRLTRPEEQTFHLLHLSLLREYIDFEFSSLKVCFPVELCDDS